MDSIRLGEFGEILTCQNCSCEFETKHPPPYKLCPNCWNIEKINQHDSYIDEFFEDDERSHQADLGIARKVRND